MDTITLQEALAGFTANESAALGSYIGLSSGGVGQKQSIAALAKVAGELPPIIGEETDMNNYTSPGVYTILDPNGQVANCPYQGAMRLEVRRFLDVYSVLQIVYTYVNDVRVFIRRRATSVWGGWVELAVK